MLNQWSMLPPMKKKVVGSIPAPVKQAASHVCPESRIGFGRNSLLRQSESRVCPESRIGFVRNSLLKSGSHCFSCSAKPKKECKKDKRENPRWRELVRVCG
jgi:hypothetical protein